MYIQKVIEENDKLLSARELELVQKTNDAYDKAVKAATKEFEYLQKLNPNIRPNSAQVKKILARVLDAFSDEMNILVEPIAKATRDSYEEGLKETSKIVEASKGG
jgi:hypothetical protein